MGLKFLNGKELFFAGHPVALRGLEPVQADLNVLVRYDVSKISLLDVGIEQLIGRQQFGLGEFLPHRVDFCSRFARKARRVNHAAGSFQFFFVVEKSIQSAVKHGVIF